MLSSSIRCTPTSPIFEKSTVQPMAAPLRINQINDHVCEKNQCAHYLHSIPARAKKLLQDGSDMSFRQLITILVLTALQAVELSTLKHTIVENS